MRLLAFFIFLATPFVHAFPENVRHGYFSCVACHVSPSGGGVLTPYGRSLSSELMSTWGTSKTSGMFFTDNEDEKKNPPWWRTNVFLRGVQTRRNSPAVEKAQFIPMQADLEAGVDLDKYAVILTGGYRAKDGSSKNLTEFFSRRHYVLYRPTDNLTFRGGKFLFSFGLNGPDHISATRRGLGWDQGTESYNFETTYSTDNFSTLATIISKSPEEKNTAKDSGIAVNSSWFIFNNSKIGISAYQGEQNSYKRFVYGPYAIFSITENLYLDSEIFFQEKEFKTGNTDKQKGYATFQRLGYEVVKGVTPYIQFDRSYLNNSDRNSQYDSYGAGFQWLPYPHFEAMTFVGREQTYRQPTTDFWWLMLHIYL